MDLASPLGVMEASLVAAAQSDLDIRTVVFDRFFETYPDTRKSFYNLEAASGRMVNETIEAMLGLAEGAPWVTTTIVNLVDLHRDYRNIPAEQYCSFVDFVVDALTAAGGSGWTSRMQSEWEIQAANLKDLIVAAI